MSFSSIHGQLLEVTVVGCQRLKDTEWISRQDPYVCLDYGGTKARTRTCKDGGKNPFFQEKFTFTLIEGLRELKAYVWNSNTVTTDDFIGNGTVSLQNVLSQGYEDSTWTLQTKTGRHAGELRVVMYYAAAKRPGISSKPLAPPYNTHSPEVPLSAAPPAAAAAAGPGPYPPALAPYSIPSPYPPYPSSGYPPSPYPSHGPSGYPSPAAYPPPRSAYHPPPPSAYPQPGSLVYPPNVFPPPQASPYHSAGPFPGFYPPPY